MKKILFLIACVLLIIYGKKWSLENDRVIRTVTYSGVIENGYRHHLILKDKDNKRYEVYFTKFTFSSKRPTRGAELTITQYTWQGMTDVYYTYKINTYKGKPFIGQGNIDSIKYLETY